MNTEPSARLGYASAGGLSDDTAQTPRTLRVAAIASRLVGSGQLFMGENRMARALPVRQPPSRRLRDWDTRGLWEAGVRRPRRWEAGGDGDHARGLRLRAPLVATPGRAPFLLSAHTPLLVEASGLSRPELC